MLGGVAIGGFRAGSLSRMLGADMRAGSGVLGFRLVGYVQSSVYV